jgi:hypothetical protein
MTILTLYVPALRSPVDEIADSAVTPAELRHLSIMN